MLRIECFLTAPQGERKTTAITPSSDDDTFITAFEAALETLPPQQKVSARFYTRLHEDDEYQLELEVAR